MSYLLAISVGPVQEFIAAARRTRDLWFGSYLLSEISKSVAKSVQDQGAELIFPATLSAESIANVIVAETEKGDPAEIVDNAKLTAKSRWLEFAKDATKMAEVAIREDIWKDQEDDVIELYAAWITFSGNYQDDRRKLMRLLAGRKNCRNFRPALGRGGVPKSSLDGQRETVLADGDRSTWPKRLRLSPGEQLDVVGVVKRVAEGTRPFPSVARVAAETWLRGMEKQGKLDRLTSACEKFVKRGLHVVQEPHYNYFRYEGTIIYKDRHPDLQEELGLDKGELDEVANELRNLGGEPIPYLAVLVADGDQIGAALSRLKSAREHRKFSTKLTCFSEAAKDIVVSEDHSGVLVYAGGDDVLAFAPVQTCLQLARALRTRFQQETDLTLSVGIAIGHFMENLEDLLEYGRAAEKAAKNPDRDALAVHLHKRGGVPIRIKSKWTDKPDDRLIRFAHLMNQRTVPTKLPYELHELAKLYESWVGASTAIQKDLYRLIAKKTSRGESSVREALSEYLVDIDSDKLLVLAEEMLIAKMIAAAMKQASGKEDR